MNTYKDCVWVCVAVIALKSVVQKRCYAHRNSTDTRQSTQSHFDRSYLLGELIISSLFILDMLIGFPKCRPKCFEDLIIVYSFVRKWTLLVRSARKGKKDHFTLYVNVTRSSSPSCALRQDTDQDVWSWV